MAILSCDWSPKSGDIPLPVTFNWSLAGVPRGTYNLTYDYGNGDTGTWQIVADSTGHASWSPIHTFKNLENFTFSYSAVRVGDAADTANFSGGIDLKPAAVTYDYKIYIKSSPDTMPGTTATWEIPATVTFTIENNSVNNSSPPEHVDGTFYEVEWWSDLPDGATNKIKANSYSIEGTSIGTNTIHVDGFFDIPDDPNKNIPSGYSYVFGNLMASVVFTSSLDTRGIVVHEAKIAQSVMFNNVTTCNKPFTSKIDWGDGITDTNVPVGPSYHKYTRAGTYTIKLITSVVGTTYSQTKTYSIKISTRDLTLTVGPSDVLTKEYRVGKEYTFTANLTPVAATEYIWHFGTKTLKGSTVKYTPTSNGHVGITCIAKTKVDGQQTWSGEILVKKQAVKIQVREISAPGVVPSTPIYEITETNGNALGTLSVVWSPSTTTNYPNITGSKFTVQNTYNTPGNYTITFKAKRDGTEDSVNKDIVLTAPPLKVTLTAKHLTGYFPLQVAPSIKIYEGKPATYEWDFGDGSPKVTTNIRTTEHIYNEKGIYTLTCKVTGLYGTEVSKEIKITAKVRPAPPVASFKEKFKGDMIRVGTEVTFVSTSTGTINSFTWYIDGVEYKDKKSVAHTFIHAGPKHTVKLVVKGDGGSDSIEKEVEVRNNINKIPLQGRPGFIQKGFIEEVSLPRTAFAWNMPTREEILAAISGFNSRKFTLFDHPATFYINSLYHIAEGLPMESSGVPFLLRKLDLNTSGFYWSMDSSPVQMTPDLRILYHVVDTLAVTYTSEMDFRLLPQADYFETTKFALNARLGDKSYLFFELYPEDMTCVIRHSDSLEGTGTVIHSENVTPVFDKILVDTSIVYDLPKTYPYFRMSFNKTTYGYEFKLSQSDEVDFKNHSVLYKKLFNKGDIIDAKYHDSLERRGWLTFDIHISLMSFTSDIKPEKFPKDVDKSAPLLTGPLGGKYKHYIQINKDKDAHGKIKGLRLNNEKYAFNSVSFWMYWTGDTSLGSAMPIGWKIHDLWITGNKFGFNTGHGDVYGVTDVNDTFMNKWVAIAATFCNGDLYRNNLYINGREMDIHKVSSSYAYLPNAWPSSEWVEKNEGNARLRSGDNAAITINGVEYVGIDEGIYTASWSGHSNDVVVNRWDLSDANNRVGLQNYLNDLDESECVYAVSKGRAFYDSIGITIKDTKLDGSFIGGDSSHTLFVVNGKDGLVYQRYSNSQVLMEFFDVPWYAGTELQISGWRISTNYPFIGCLSELCVYRGRLTASEAWKHYSGVPLKRTPAGIYHFDERYDSEIKFNGLQKGKRLLLDSSGNNAHGYMVGDSHRGPIFK